MNNFEFASVCFNQGGEAFDPITIVAVQQAIDFTDFLLCEYVRKLPHHNLLGVLLWP